MNYRTVTLLLTVAIVLTACGRQGRIEAPDGQVEDRRLEDFRNGNTNEEDGRA